MYLWLCGGQLVRQLAYLIARKDCRSGLLDYRKAAFQFLTTFSNSFLYQIAEFPMASFSRFASSFVIVIVFTGFLRLVTQLQAKL